MNSSGKIEHNMREHGKAEKPRKDCDYEKANDQIVTQM